MATEQVVEGLQIALSATASLAGKLYYIAALDSAGGAVLAAAASDKLLGPIREEATAGNPATVQFGGIGKVIAGGAIVPGDLITSDGNGKGIATTSTGNRTIGFAMTAADASDICSVFLVPGSV